MRKILHFDKITNFQTFLVLKLRFWLKKVGKSINFEFSQKKNYFQNWEKKYLVIMSIIYRKSNNIIDFMNCSKSQLNASYKYWFIKLSIFMWVYGWKVSVCIGWQCMYLFNKYITPCLCNYLKNDLWKWLFGPFVNNSSFSILSKLWNCFFF